MIEKNPSAGGAVTDGLYQAQLTDVTTLGSPEIEIEIEIEGDEDGTLDAPEVVEDKHFDNLLETKFKGEEAKRELDVFITELIADVENDLRSRDAWEQTYKKGLKLLGLTIEERTEPWENACGVFHPLLTEAVVRFQSETIVETFPAQGPVKTQIIGKQTPYKMLAADRVRDDMNWRLTDEMQEYRVEHERMLWNLPIAGSAFKKVYKDETLGRQAALFVAADDVIVNYGSADLASAERVTHRMRKTKNWLEAAIAAGTYKDYDIGEPSSEVSELQQEKDKLIGTDSANSELYEIYEIQVNTNMLEGQATACPYIVSYNNTDRTCLSIRRNWNPGDARKTKKEYFVHYQYIVGFGFYGFGLVHLVGGHANAGTSLLRQLVDAGTLSNLPGGFKAKGMRVKNEDDPIKPGEFRDVDVGSGAVKDNVMALPYKEPSGTLFQLLQSIAEDGRRTANIADVDFSASNQNAPVGTTLALIERQLKTLSAVQARIHASMRVEFKMLKELIRNNGERGYPYDIADADKRVKDADYDVVEILPVSDPNAATMGVRIAQYQTVLELAQRNPQLYDQAYLHREMVNTLGVKNAAKIVPLPEEQKPRDPIAENMAILMNKPVRAFIHQDHQAHIQVHQAFLNDPKIGMLLGQNPNAQIMFNAAQAHIAEHAAYAYRDQIQKAMGVSLPDPNEPMDPETEYLLAGMLAQAAQSVQAQNANEQAQAQAQQQAQDPVLQMQAEELRLKGREVAVKERKQALEEQVAAVELQNDSGAADSQAKLQVAQAKMADTAQMTQAKLAEAAQKMRMNEQTHAVTLAAKIAEQRANQRRKDEAHRVSLAQKQAQAKKGDKE